MLVSELRELLDELPEDATVVVEVPIGDPGGTMEIEKAKFENGRVVIWLE